MRKIVVILMIGFFALFLGCSKQSGSLDKKAFLQFSIGDVKIVKNDKNIKPVVGMEIEKGMTIETGSKSLMSIQIGTNALLKIESNSKILMETVLSSKSIELFLKKGKVLINVSKLLKGESFKVKTPVTVAAVRGTRFSVAYNKKNSRAIVVVAKGKIAVVQQDKKEVIVKEKKVAIVDKKVVTRDIGKVEDLELSKVSDNLIIENPKDFQSIKKKEEILIKKEKTFQKEIDKRKGYSLKDLRAQYGRIDQVILYSGKKYSGVIVKRGLYTSILTTNGKVRIKSVKISRTITK